MNVPAISKKTFEALKEQSGFIHIVESIIKRLKKISHPHKRAQLIHKIIDEFNEEVFAHPLVQQFSPCTMGCSACCHTQVSVTADEASLIAKKIDEGLEIDRNRLHIQMHAENKSQEFYKIPFENRKCIFLSSEGGCRVYEDRPSVCRTNAVLGSAGQCDTTESIQKTILVKTTKADMAIYASFSFAKSSGTLSYMVGKLVKKA